MTTAAVRLRSLTKRFAGVTAVDELTLDVRPGHVTGFLGPNGAGKTTTMRMVLGLDRPTSGSAWIGGRPYADLPHPSATVGALLDARAVHPSRSAAGNLRALAAASGLPRRRVDEVLGLVGLEKVAGRRVGGFSLGMLQRLGMAGALLGDPGVLLFDEPVNGLDPEGVRWVRHLMRGLAAEGRTVLVSSHLMSEMALTADQLVVIGRGRLIADEPVADLLAMGGQEVTVVLAPPDGADVPAPGPAAATAPPAVDVAAFAQRLERAGARVLRESPPGRLRLTGLDATSVGRIAAADRVPLAELATRTPSLEDVFMALTQDSVEYAAAGAVPERSVTTAGAR